jgi:hypothetical protein
MPSARHVGLQAADALAYVVVLTGGLFLLGSALGFALGQGLVGTKYLLFFAGFGMFGYATFLLRPSAPWKGKTTGRSGGSGRSSGSGTGSRSGPGSDSPPGGDGADTGRFGGGGLLPTGSASGSDSLDSASTRGRDAGEREAQDKPTHRLASRLLPPRMRLPPEQRLSAGAKMLLAAVAVLATSYLLEAAFGVGG